MPIPITPIAAVAIRYGSIAIATYAITRAIPKLRRTQAIEDTLDTVEEGIEFRRDPEQVNATGRLRRVIQVGRSGPAFEIDATALARLKIRKVTR